MAGPQKEGYSHKPPVSLILEEHPSPVRIFSVPQSVLRSPLALLYPGAGLPTLFRTVVLNSGPTDFIRLEEKGWR